MKRLFPALALLLLSIPWINAQKMAAQTGPSQASEDGQKAATASQADDKGADAETSPSQETASTAPQPHTDIVLETATAPDPILDPGPLPNLPMSLIGGTVRRVDGIRNRVVIQPFGGGRETTVQFDDRSHIYRNGAITSLLGIHRGDRIYVDTMIVDHRVFARTIRVETTSEPVEAYGQIVHFNPANRTVEMHDSLTSQTVSFTISDQTTLRKKEGTASLGDLMPGTLIQAVFAPGRKGEAQQVSILAVPGSKQVFLGRITYVDVRRGLLAIDNEADQKTYEIHYTPASIPARNELRVGARITADTSFDGSGYQVESIKILEPAAENNSAQR